MPLSFESLSHGTIAFGFFNIESDMLLCDRYFLFADDFCANIVALVENAGDTSYRAAWEVQTIEKAEDIRPDYVLDMKKQIMLKRIGIFDNIEFLD
jgi:hypothetical protein